jgi:hypothetical protein
VRHLVEEAFEVDRVRVGVHPAPEARGLAPDGKDPVVFQGLNPGGAEAAIGYTIPNLLIDRPAPRASGIG